MIYRKYQLTAKFLLNVLILSISLTVNAHNNVVVVSMAGDELPVDLKPTANVANASPFITNYTVSSFTIVDEVTNFEWQRQDDDTERNWDDAWDYCANLNIVGNDDWRLPNVTELQSIVDYDLDSFPVIYAEFSNTKGAYYWSASSDVTFSTRAWAVNFTSGSIFPWTSDNEYYVRCVRQP